MLLVLEFSAPLYCMYKVVRVAWCSLRQLRTSDCYCSVLVVKNDEMRPETIELL